METMFHPALLMMQYLISKKYLEIDPLPGSLIQIVTSLLCNLVKLVKAGKH